MTVMVERSVDIPKLLDDLGLPEDFRAEYVEGGYLVTPPPAVLHDSIAADMTLQLNCSGLRREVRPPTTGYCKTTECADLRKGNHLIPDLSVLSRPFTPAEVAASELHRNWISADAVDLVVEITSTDRNADLVLKLTAYGRLGIPHYLVVDRDRHESVLFTKPSGDVPKPGYGAQQAFPFGQDVQLPAPYPALKTTLWR